MRDILSDLAGGPLPDWSWLKATLPSSLGGLNIRRASLHAAPAAYVGSFLQYRSLIASILGHTAQQPVHFPDSNSRLAQAAARPDWVSTQDIDVPPTQHCLSRSIDDLLMPWWPQHPTLTPKPLPSRLLSNIRVIG